MLLLMITSYEVKAYASINSLFLKFHPQPYSHHINKQMNQLKVLERQQNFRKWALYVHIVSDSEARLLLEEIKLCVYLTPFNIALHMVVTHDIFVERNVHCFTSK